MILSGNLHFMVDVVVVEVAFVVEIMVDVGPVVKAVVNVLVVVNVKARDQNILIEFECRIKATVI